MQYIATLFRGWEVVRLNYALEKDAVIQRRKRTWKALEEQRVELASLSGEVRRVWARQAANPIGTAVLLAILLILGVDAIYHGMGAGNGIQISWPLWGPLLAIGGYVWVVRHKTRKPAEWSHFLGTNKGGGLFVLRDPRNAKAHEKFVAAVRRQLPEFAGEAAPD